MLVGCLRQMVDGWCEVARIAVPGNCQTLGGG